MSSTFTDNASAAENVRRSFASAWGAIGAAWGVAPSTAAVQGYLLVSDGPLTEPEVRRALGMSHRAASLALAQCEEWGLIERAEAPRRSGQRGPAAVAWSVALSLSSKEAATVTAAAVCVNVLRAERREMGKLIKVPVLLSGLLELNTSAPSNAKKPSFWRGRWDSRRRDEPRVPCHSWRKISARSVRESRRPHSGRYERSHK